VPLRQVVAEIEARRDGDASFFQQAQGELSSALSRLMAVVENYPNLKANQGFQDLRTQLEGTENRITVARNQYIQAVQQYNVLRRSFPTNLTAMVFGYDVKPTFGVANEALISAPPTVDDINKIK
jgi:LemA protein